LPRKIGLFQVSPKIETKRLKVSFGAVQTSYQDPARKPPSNDGYCVAA